MKMSLESLKAKLKLQEEKLASLVQKVASTEAEATRLPEIVAAVQAALLPIREQIGKLCLLVDLTGEQIAVSISKKRGTGAPRASYMRAGKKWTAKEIAAECPLKDADRTREKVAAWANDFLDTKLDAAGLTKLGKSVSPYIGNGERGRKAAPAPLPAQPQPSNAKPQPSFKRK